MAQLQIPLSIWLEASKDERDGFFLAAGFNPNLPVEDNGTTNEFVRFRQIEVPTPQHSGAFFVATTPSLQAGDDLRDFQNVSLTGDNPITDEFGIAAGAGTGGTALAIAGRALKLILGGGGGRLLAATWNSLPSVARSALTQVGIGVGALIAFNGDIPFITLPGQGSSVATFDASQEGGAALAGGPGAATRHVDIQIGSNPLQPVQVVGSWIANGVVFYRLADGKLAVQNKKGRWKVWRPRKPIVLYADGASSLKTMLRADKALNKQSKKIAAMLNRRAPRRKSSAATPHNPIILGNNARVVDV